MAALLVAVAGSVPLGSRSTLLCILTATLVLFYNGPGKHIAGLGIVTLGLVRGIHMLIADPRLGYLWPVWLTVTHIIGLSALCHRLEEKRPPLAGPHVWVVTLGWAFISIAMIAWMEQRDWLILRGPVDRPWIWAGPGIAAVLFVLIAIHTTRTAANPQAAGALIMKRGLLWLIVYDAAWLAGAGLWKAAAVNGALLPATWLLMSLLRQLKVLTQSPVQFQR